MYVYTPADQALVEQRVAQFAEQLGRYQRGELAEEHFQPLRLQNGIYIQRHAPMMRVAIPYGTFSSAQLNGLASIADRYDRGYGHFTTRQNIQFNWLDLDETPAVLADLAKIQMHAIQTSGNCVRNTTTDPFAGTTPDEAIDPRVICELIRQWSTFHPEFAFLPRKFKIAVKATDVDRAALAIHDVGIHIKRHAVHGLAFDLWVGGGLGRTPHIATHLLADLPLTELRNWLNATLRVYNMAGRRDNKYKARIKILLNAMGAAAFSEEVTRRYQLDRQDELRITEQDLQSLAEQFKAPVVAKLPPTLSDDAAFLAWYEQNTRQHRITGHRAVLISLKRPGIAPGDISSDEMRVVASVATRYGHSEIRSTHDQNLVLPWVASEDLLAVWQQLTEAGLVHANIGLISDSIACPGLDFCGLANAPTLSLAEGLHQHFADLELQRDIGPVEIKISGCMNACGHHHIGHIGILGVDKKGSPWYQITLGGRDEQGAVLGKHLGPAVEHDGVLPLIERLMTHYRAIRETGETFVDCVDRVGTSAFKEVAYASH